MLGPVTLRNATGTRIERHAALMDAGKKKIVSFRMHTSFSAIREEENVPLKPLSTSCDGTAEGSDSGETSLERRMITKGSCHSVMSPSTVLSFNSFDSGSKSGQKLTLEELARADEPMPFRPFCARCAPIRPTDCLSLRPSEVNIPDAAKKFALEQVERAAKAFKPGMKFQVFRSNRGGAGFAENGEGNQPPVAIMKMAEFKLKLEMTRNGKRTRRSYGKEVASIELPPRLKVSRFSQKMVVDSERPVVHGKLTEEQLCLLERWAINHVKSFYVSMSAYAHSHAPVKVKRHRAAMASSTTCQLMRRLHEGAGLTKEQRSFLETKLRNLPYFDKVPEELFDSVMSKVTVRSHVAGAIVFRQGEVVDGLHVLMLGEVELRNEVASNLALDTLKEAPAGILHTDVLDSTALRDCMLKKVPGDIIWSRTAAVPVDTAAGSFAVTIFLPSSVVREIHDYQYSREAEILDNILTTVFAPMSRLAPSLCLKHRGHFEFTIEIRNHILFQEGSKPALSDARIIMIVEGNVTLTKAKQRRPKSARKNNAAADNKVHFAPGSDGREIAGTWRLIGDEALYGEPYSMSAVVTSDRAKLLCITAKSYLENLLRRNHKLERSAYATTQRAGVFGDGRMTRSRTMGQDRSVHTEDDSSSNADEAADCRSLAEIVNEQCCRRVRILRDRQGLMPTYWKMLQHKTEFPKRVPPHNAPKKAIVMAIGGGEDGFGRADLSAPRDEDLFPCVQRTAIAMLRSDPSAKRAHMKIPTMSEASTQSQEWSRSNLSDEFAKVSSSLADSFVSTRPSLLRSLGVREPHTMVSLNRAITQQAATQERLEIEHASHKQYGFHVEDVDGLGPQLGPVLVPREKSTLMLACGAMAKAMPSGRTVRREPGSALSNATAHVDLDVAAALTPIFRETPSDVAQNPVALPRL